jgi:Phage Tail Collar Domain
VTQAFWIIRTAGAAAPRVPFWEGPENIFRREVGDAIAALNAAPAWLPGMIIKWGGATAPAGFLVCDGSLLSRRDYSALFAAIGERFGTGDGSSTFPIPTQAQCDATVVQATPPQTVTGGSVEPVTPPVVVPGVPGASGGNSGTGGRPRNPDEREV